VKLRLVSTLLAALALAPALAAPAAAQTASPESADAGQFIDKMADTAFGILKSGSGGSPTPAQRTRFHSLLANDFAIKQIGDRLIRRWRPTITPAQYAAYSAAFPDYIINTYADRLYDYANADLKVTRVTPVGSGWAVYTTVAKSGTQPVTAIWSVVRGGSGFQVTNLTVGGVNLALTQSADFDSYVQSHGFDALVTFMKSRHS
jgi:phospholipid transport system substrate-binding protein